MTPKHHREFIAASIATIVAGMAAELLETGGWIGPVLACIGVAAALFLAWDMPRISTPPNFHGQTTIQPPEDATDGSYWPSTLPQWAPSRPSE